MSEVFDPEKISRYYPATEHDAPVPYAFMDESMGGDYVRASDYDQLLALYREAVGQWRELRDGIDDLHFRLAAQKAPPDTDLPTIEEMRGLLDRH